MHTAKFKIVGKDEEAILTPDAAEERGLEKDGKCPECGGEVRFRRKGKNAANFAHRTNAPRNCPLRRT